MAIFKPITQGGQVHIHQLVMLKQIVVAGFIVAAFAGGGYFAYLCTTIPYQAWRMTYEIYWARMMFATTPESMHKTITQKYIPQNGTPYKRTSLSVLKDSRLLMTTERVEKYLETKLRECLKVSVYAFLATMCVWFGMGCYQRRTRHERGNTIVHWKRLRRLLKKKRKGSDLHLGGLPLIKNKETSHMLITGTTGSGKTNAFHILLPQIRKRGDRAILIDVTGSFVSRYYNKQTDIILNPLDVRSKSWHPWADCYVDSHYDVLAESFIQPRDGNREPFWDNASQVLFKTALRKYAAQECYDVHKLYTFLMSASDKEFDNFFKGTEAATLASKNNEKTTYSIRSTLSSQIECIRQLETPKDHVFSIRDWVTAENHEGWLFITAMPDQRETLRPLISAWIDIAINALMVLPEDQNRRLWFVMDELAALQKLPRLQTGLAEGRKYGACILVGFQSKQLLEDIYGKNSTEAMLDLFNTKVFFHSSEPSTQAWISKVLGDREETEVKENISYGSHHMRDGVSLSHQTQLKPLVLPTELGQLKDMECYIKLPGDFPITTFQCTLQKPPSKTQAPFILKPEMKRDYVSRVVEVSDNKKEDLI